MRYTWLADVLRDAGLRVVEVAGWRTRGADTFGPVRGITCHHTAGSRNSTDEGEIRTLLKGSVSAPPPIAQLYLSRSGTWHVVAAGLCYHNKVGWAGPNEGYGNDALLGIEAQHSGSGESWTDVQYDSYVRGVAALVRHRASGWSPAVGRIAGHKEHQPGAKSDPTFNMSNFRGHVAKAIEEWDDVTPEQARNEAKAAIREMIPAIADAVWDELANVNVGPRAVDDAGRPRPASNQKMRGIVSHLSPEGHETRKMLAELSAELDKVAESVDRLAGLIERRPVT